MILFLLKKRIWHGIVLVSFPTFFSFPSYVFSSTSFTRLSLILSMIVNCETTPFNCFKGKNTIYKLYGIPIANSFFLVTLRYDFSYPLSMLNPEFRVMINIHSNNIWNKKLLSHRKQICDIILLLLVDSY